MDNAKILKEVLDDYEKEHNTFKREKFDADMQVLNVVFEAMKRVKNCLIADVVGQSEQLAIQRCECEHCDPTEIKVCTNCDGYVE